MLVKMGNALQIGVEGEYIVAADIFQGRNDVWTLVSFLKYAKNQGVTSENEVFSDF